MIMKLTNPKPNTRLWLMGLILFVLPGFLLACGGGSGSSDSASDTCALTFNIEWNRETQIESTTSKKPRLGEFSLTDCVGIDSVSADVYNMTGTLLQNGGPWQCSAGRGEMQNVPAGSTGQVTVYGMDASGDILYWGQSAEIQLVSSETVNTGTISANSFVPLLSAPTNGSTVTSTQWQLQWESVANAAQYRIVISANQDLSAPEIDTTAHSSNTVYSPAGLQDGNYYWQLRAIDINGNESAGSEIWGFTLSLQDNTAPTAQIESPNDDAVYQSGATIIFSGIGSDIEDGLLSGDALSWTSDMDGALGTGTVLQTNTLSLGTHSITLTATDSLHATGTAIITVTVVESSASDISGIWQFSTAQPWATGDAGCTPGANTSGTCLITQIGNNFTLEFLTGWTCDPPFTCTYNGTVSDDRYVGTNSGVADTDGGVVTNSIDFSVVSANSLSGESTSQYDIDGYQCRWGYDFSMTPESDGDTEVPVAHITTPLNQSTYEHEERILFGGSGTDAEDGDLSGDSMVWTSSIDGQFHTGASFFYDSLSVGTHQITLTVVDSQNATHSETITITINSPPSVTISSPQTGDRFDTGTSITFTGSATDPEDGALGDSALTWQSSINGMLGTGSSITATDLSYGQHIITLSSVDSRGASSTATINLRLNNLPSVNLLYPLNNDHYTPGALVGFETTTSDPEDGFIPDSSIVWTSSIDGQVATGSDTGSSSLSYGSHTLTCTVTDSLGDSSSQSINLVINTPPVATLTQPLPTMYFIGETIDCQGSWTDAEDFILLIFNLVWSYQEYSNGVPVGPETTIGVGNNQTVSFSNFATYRIRFRVTDSLGDTDVAYVDIFIGG